jgi:hypothetical protein
MRCSSCHQNANFDPARVPGHSEWHLAPREMAWEGKSVAEICAQIKHPARNGGRKLEDLIHHIGEDTLVGWAWAPGFGRAPHPETSRRARRSLDQGRRGVPGEMIGLQPFECAASAASRRPHPEEPRFLRDVSKDGRESVPCGHPSRRIASRCSSG